jgi:ubiquinol-cytochrome c reductase iron-sulfur subunit
MITVEWRGKPVWIINRNPPMLETLPKLNDRWPTRSPKEHAAGVLQERDALDQARVSWSSSASVRTWAARPRPSSRAVPQRHGCRLAGRFPVSLPRFHFDFAGRVFKSKPAPDNLEVPPHMYLSDKRILIGEDKKGA